MDDILQQLLTHVRSMWRYRWYAITLTWLVCVIGWYQIYKLPDLYKVTTNVHVDTESVLRPLLHGLTIEPGFSQRMRLVTNTLLSVDNMEKLINIPELKEYTENKHQRDTLIRYLKNNIKISRSKTNENIYNISFEHRDKNVAYLVIKSFLKVLVENAMEEGRESTGIAQEFIEKQIQGYEKKLFEAEERLEEFKRKNAKVLPTLGQGYYKNLQAVRDSLSEAELKLDEAVKRRDELKRQISGEEPVFGFAASQGAKSSHPLDVKIQELQKQLDDLLLQYTELHPKVKSLQENIKKLEETRNEDLANQPVNMFLQQSLETNPVYQQLSVALSEAEAEVAALRVRVKEYKARESDLQEKVDTIPHVEAELNRLNRDYEINKRNYDELVRRRETARITEDVEKTGGTIKIEILDPPRIPVRPSGPDRMIYNSVVFILGLAMAIGLSFLVSQIRPVVHDQRTLRNLTGLPVFGIVSRITTETMKKQKRIEYGGFITTLLLLFSAFGGLLIIEYQ